MSADRHDHHDEEEDEQMNPTLDETPVEEVVDEKTGAVRRFMHVRIDDLNIDQHYQRDLSMDLVEKISREYDPAATSAITVVRRPNGSLYIVNGQHRAAGAKRHGEEFIMAEVFEGIDPEHEAALRLKGNTRKTDKPQERFRAQLAAGDEESLAIAAIAESFDTEVNRNPDPNRGINAISALETIYRRDRNGTTLTRVLELIQQSFGECHGKAVSVAMMKGIAFLLDRNGTDMDRQRMIDKLNEYGPNGIHRIAVNHKAAMGGAMWMNYYRAMIEVYNEKLGERARLEWRTSGASRAFRDAGDSNPGAAGESH